MSRSLKRQQNFENDVNNGKTSKRAQRKGASSRILVSLSCSGSRMDLDLPFHTRAIENDDSREEIICYGAICDAQILLNSQTEKPKATQPWDRYCLFGVEIHDGICYLSTGMNVKPSQRSVLDCHTGSVLMFTTNKVRGVSFAVVLAADILHRKRGKSSKKSAVKTTVNIYGPRGSMVEVDKGLSEIGSDLQHPVFLEHGIAYINPQFYYPSSEKTDLRHLVGPACVNTQSETSREVSMVMDCLDNWSEDITTGDNAGADLHRILDQFLFETKLKDLLSHREALGLGGILADVMGLGKTLTMLSAILCSQLLRNYAFNDKADESSDYQPRSSNLTLIVLPSRQLIDVWKNEIDRRFQPQTFKTTIFHGYTRAKTRDLLVDNDIVLTTYHTLEKDNSGQGILSSITWSRIVLDEAHHIRNPSIKMHKAAAALQSNTRWCLTGTPIQNSFDDLRSLFQFLRFQPFSQNKVFEEHIVKPFREGTNSQLDPSRNLKVMLKACCLRKNTSKTGFTSNNPAKSGRSTNYS
ncbi:Helicase superfamily 1/2, ATP-binding domain [Fusarium oxysporum f. sp. vasinfectum]|nr:Helicase superfamily 1/2, ATP-binding domain [Fusarium oxysporum f. sp. vasinfectum]